MGSINNGGQVISFSYKEDAKGQLFNLLNHKVLPRGVYSGGAFTRINDTTLQVAPLVCVYDDDTNTVTARIETTSNATVTVAPATPFIVLRYTWLNSASNFADIISLQYSDILSSDIILGRLIFNSSVLTTSYDYSRKNWSSLYFENSLNYLPEYLVTAQEPYTTSVEIYPGPAYLIGGKYSTPLGSSTSSSAFASVGVNGRKDAVCLDSSGAIIIVEGDNTTGYTVTPIIDDSLVLLAFVTFPSGSNNTVRGDYISYVNPKHYKSGQISKTNSSTFNLDAGNAGPQLKNTSGDLEIKDSTGATQKKVFAATPTSTDTQGLTTVDYLTQKDRVTYTSGDLFTQLDADGRSSIRGVANSSVTGTPYSANWIFEYSNEVVGGTPVSRVEVTLENNSNPTRYYAVKVGTWGSWVQIADVGLVSAETSRAEAVEALMIQKVFFLSTSSYVIPSGISRVYLTGTAAGGNGGNGGSNSSGSSCSGGGGGGGGGSGEHCIRLGLAVSPGQTVTATIGAVGSNTTVSNGVWTLTLACGSTGGNGAISVNQSGRSTGGSGGASIPNYNTSGSGGYGSTWNANDSTAGGGTPWGVSPGTAGYDVNAGGGGGGAGASGPLGQGGVGGNGQGNAIPIQGGGNAVGYGSGGGGGGGAWGVVIESGGSGGSGGPAIVIMEF